MSFSDQIRRFSVKAQAEIQRVRRGVTIKLLGAIVLDTPVLTGRLRGNWSITEGEPSPAMNWEKQDKTGTTVLTAIQALVGLSNGGRPIYLTNNVPYGPRIEFDGWSHTKAPDGMVRRNVLRFGRIITVTIQGGK